MAAFGFTRPGGVWAELTDLLDTELADLDSKTKRALNADDGGTWAPAGAITIGGQGVTLTGANHHLAGGLNIDSGGVLNAASGSQVIVAAGASLLLGGTLASSGHLTGTLTVDSGANLDFAGGSALDLTGTLFCHAGGLLDILNGGNIQVRSGAGIGVSAGGIIDLSGTLTGEPSSTVSLGGTNNLTGTNSISGPTDVSAVVSLSGSGHINDRVLNGTVDADHTYGIADAVVFVLGAISTPRVYKVTSTGAGLGSRVRFVAPSSTTNIVTLQQDNGSTIAGFIGTAVLDGVAAVSGRWYWIDLIHTGAANGWRICGGQVVP